MKQQTYIMLTADEGMMLTNGEVYGKTVVLGTGNSPESYREITEAEYKTLIDERDHEVNADV